MEIENVCNGSAESTSTPHQEKAGGHMTKGDGQQPVLGGQTVETVKGKDYKVIFKNCFLTTAAS